MSLNRVVIILRLPGKEFSILPLRLMLVMGFWLIPIVTLRKFSFNSSFADFFVQIYIFLLY